MSPLDHATVLRRIDTIAANGRAASLIDAADALSITLTRLDALADDLRKGLHSSDDAAKEAAPAEQIVENWEPKHG